MFCWRFLTPLGSGPAAQAANFPNHKKIEKRAKEREEHHRDADGILMKPFSGGVDAGGSRECAQADGYAKSADGDDGSAGALQDGENNSGPA